MGKELFKRGQGEYTIMMRRVVPVRANVTTSVYLQLEKLLSFLGWGVPGAVVKDCPSTLARM
jgi:hypothetical protein